MGANFMETHGATRICPHDKSIITDYEITEVPPQQNTIFIKQGHIMPIKTIVDAFKTRQHDETVLDNNDIVSPLTDELTKLFAKSLMNIYNDTELAQTIDTVNSTSKEDKKRTEPVEIHTNRNIDLDKTSTDIYVDDLVKMLQIGGAKSKKTKKTTKKSKTVSKIKGRRTIIKVSNKKKSKNVLKELARSAAIQKKKFLDEALEKILAHLTDKDTITAQAIRAILNNELKETHGTMTSLDRAAELLKIITKQKVQDVLKKTKEIQKFKDYMSAKAKPVYKPNISIIKK
jgi:hypothetical protein